jgi:hypothetical protein
MPGYYPQSFPPPSPYPSSGSPTTSSVMSASPAPIIATNLPPMQSQVHSMPATPATDNNKRRQVKNACSKYSFSLYFLCLLLYIHKKNFFAL